MDLTKDELLQHATHNESGGDRIEIALVDILLAELTVLAKQLTEANKALASVYKQLESSRSLIAFENTDDQH